MTDHEKVYPASKPMLNGNQATTNSSSPFPPPKSQLYGATRPAYRPQPLPKHHKNRSCSACCCCLWITLFIIALILLTAITGAIFWVIYRPQRPSFSVTTLRIPQFNITTTSNKDADSSSTHLNSKLDLTVSAKNPNKKVSFIYDPITVVVRSSKGVEVGRGSFPSFVHGTKNTTLIKASATSTGTSSSGSLDPESATSLKADLKKKSGVPLEIQLDTKVKVKMGGFKTNKVRIRVTCSGIKAVVAPQKKTTAPATNVISSSSGDVKCKVNLRIKIWKWTF